MMVPTAWSTLLAFLVAVGVVHAQQRAAVNGVVIDAAGEPLADAVVTFVGAPLPIVDAHANVDRVEVRSDRDGRFSAPLLQRADYSAWAAAPRSRDRLASAVRHPVAGGDQVVLTVDRAAPLRMLRPLDLAAWEEHGPCALAVAPVLPVVAPQSIALQRGAATLPPFAGPWHLFVRDASGRLVHAETLAPDRDGLAEPAIRAPHPVQVRTVDENGGAVAGAELWFRLGSRLQRPVDVAGTPCPAQWQPAGTTGSDGTLDLALDVAGEDVLAIVARAPGRSVGAAAVGAPAAAAPARFLLPIVLPAGDGTVAYWPNSGRKLHGRVLPGITVRAVPGTRREWQMVVDPQGNWQADIEPHGVARAVAVMPAGAGVVPMISQFDARERRTLRVADLAALRLHGAGAPLRLLVQPVPDLTTSTAPPITTLAVTLPAFLRLGVGRWRLLASDGEGFALHEVDVLPGVTDLPLQLQPLAERRGRLLADGGPPPRGATIRCPTKWPRDDGSLAVQLEPFAQPALAQALPVLPDDLAFALSTWLASRGRVRDDGSFTVAMLRCYTPRLSFVIEASGRSAVLPAYLQRPGQ